MSRGLLRKIRKNPDFIEVVRILREIGLEYEIEVPSGKGHPIIRVGTVRWTIASSPSPYMRVANIRTQLRKRLRAAGLIS